MRHDVPALILGLAAACLPVATRCRAAATTGTLSASYDGYAHGVVALRLTASFNFTPGAYSGRLEFHTAGMIGWMVHIESDSQVEGRFATAPALTANPMRYDTTGVMRGTDRVTHMVFQDGNPVVKSISPPPEQERSPVTAAQTAHTIDTLSAIALLMRQVAQSGRCDGHATTFDGRRVTELVARTGGDDTIAPITKVHFDGHTLRCDFVGTQTAGFIKSQDEDRLRRSRHGSAWLAPLVPGAPPVPVKVEFENQALGLVTMYLTSVSGSPGPVAQNH